MNGLSLYTISSQYRVMAELLSDLDLDDQTLADTLEGESGALVEKSTSVAMVVRNLEASAAAIKDAEAQMALRRKAIENRATRLKAYLMDCMKVAGIQKIDSPHFSISIKKNPVSVDIYEPGILPAAYMADPPPPPPMADKTLIKRAIQDGFDVPGARLVQGERVDIR